jgi:hypothetical protein
VCCKGGFEAPFAQQERSSVVKRAQALHDRKQFVHCRPKEWPAQMMEFEDARDYRKHGC